ncbi:MAG: hypothetical protein J0H06_14995 [Actinobacteria bacterium]|nr:hypothetical protein [Actinomycetota bacterium]
MEELEAYLAAVQLAPGWTGPATVLRAGVSSNRQQIEMIEQMVAEGQRVGAARVESVPMRIDLSDLDRLEGIAEALGRLFWCLMAVAFLAAILGSPGTGLLILVLGGAAFCARVGFEDFVRSRREGEARPATRESRPAESERRPAEKRPAEPDPEFTVYRSARKRRTRSAV